MRYLLGLLFTFALSFFGYAQSAGYTCAERHQQPHNLKTSEFKSGDEIFRSDTIDLIHTSIYLDFTNDENDTISGFAAIKFESLIDVSTISFDLQDLDVDSIVYHGGQISFSHNDTLLVANFGATISASTTDSISIYYSGSPKEDPSTWGGFYFEPNYTFNLGVAYLNQPHSFGRAWHPCFDNFVERCTYDFEILTDQGATAYCNGTRIFETSVGTDSLLTRWEMNTEIPAYLASVAVSDYAHVEENYYSALQNTNIPLWLVARPSDTTNMKNSFANLQQAIAHFEDSFGPYVWEKIGYVAVPFNAGAVEHATNIAYPVLTINGNLQFETIMAHEIAHHWWGDWVTPQSAEEMWISEGISTYCERLFLEDVYDYDAYMAEMRTNHKNVLHRAHISDSGFYALSAVPLKYTYDQHVYNKGSDVMHTMRSYLGDTDFFEALKALQIEFGGGAVSSIEMRDYLVNQGYAAAGDFFNDWVLQPGFSHFAFANQFSIQNGSNYDVTLTLDQKLKGASNYHTNVPLTLTFMDENWNSHEEEILMSGDYQQFIFTMPFDPIFAAVNMNERINDAITAENLTITGPQSFNLNYTNLKVTIDGVTDSALMRIEHNWVAPDVMNNPENILISKDRYWNIHGINLESVSGELRFEYNGRNIPTGDLDNSLMNDTGSELFTEDSLVLLYRPDYYSDWEVHSDYTYAPTGATDDKFGFMTANFFAPGQYTFGYRTSSVGIEDESYLVSNYAIYPNPTNQDVMIDLTNWKQEPILFELYTLNGQYVKSATISGGMNNTIDVQELASGTYFILLKDKSGFTKGSSQLLIRKN
ncbi:MAG: M1 family aminopeptidase [Crocinitomicaceae bacterium]